MPQRQADLQLWRVHSDPIFDQLQRALDRRAILGFLTKGSILD
jgi:hypothetical protein